MTPARPSEGPSSGSGEPSGTPPPSDGPPKRKRGRQPRTSIPCQVEGCEAELIDEKGYYKRYQICREHCCMSSLEVGGVQQRFCQQCGRFQDLADFDGSKKSCTQRLKQHNEQRLNAKKLKRKSAATLEEGEEGQQSKRPGGGQEAQQPKRPSGDNDGGQPRRRSGGSHGGLSKRASAGGDDGQGPRAGSHGDGDGQGTGTGSAGPSRRSHDAPGFGTGGGRGPTPFAAPSRRKARKADTRALLGPGPQADAPPTLIGGPGAATAAGAQTCRLQPHATGDGAPPNSVAWLPAPDPGLSAPVLEQLSSALAALLEVQQACDDAQQAQQAACDVQQAQQGTEQPPAAPLQGGEPPAQGPLQGLEGALTLLPSPVMWQLRDSQDVAAAMLASMAPLSPLLQQGQQQHAAPPLDREQLQQPLEQQGQQPQVQQQREREQQQEQQQALQEGLQRALQGPKSKPAIPTQLSSGPTVLLRTSHSGRKSCTFQLQAAVGQGPGAEERAGRAAGAAGEGSARSSDLGASARTDEGQVDPTRGHNGLAPSETEFSQMQDLLSKCVACGSLDQVSALRYRSILFNHRLTPAQRAEDLSVFAALVEAGALADVADCVRQALAAMAPRQQA